MVTDFRDTLLVLATVEDSPGDTARVLALEEEGLGLSILEAEDLAVATDVQLTLLQPKKIKSQQSWPLLIMLAIVGYFFDDFVTGLPDITSLFHVGAGGEKRTFPG